MPWTAPTRVTERREKLRRCGSRAFLDPAGLRYPVAPSGSCKPNCAGLLAAMRRAVTQREWNVAAKARRVACSVGCEWPRRRGCPPR